ncbi:protein kinase domain containing protein [Nitzschia inconspicua]|uniref:Protein kinase domain containing protein n=1 Tax=Nitzschia inconspicua TaxID=303405 RepID=A0A9K3KG43_9STRA|nr:protein kinase domain containing protein [Nitzschia inconspicua]
MSEATFKNDDSDYTLAVIRRLTRPVLNAPSPEELGTVLMEPWPIRVAVSPTDYTTLNHWKGQEHTPLFHSMLEWPNENSTDAANPTRKKRLRPTAHLHPFFSFGDPTSPFFFNPSQDIGNCLRNLLLHQVASHQALGHDITLSAHGTDLFVATGKDFAESELDSLRIAPKYYLLRCHHDKNRNELQFGYHRHRCCHHPTTDQSLFHKLYVLSLHHKDWRLTTCILLKNMTRIVLCLKDYAIPLVSRPEKLSLVQVTDVSGKDDCNTDSSQTKQGCDKQRPRSLFCIQKVYDKEYICDIFNATVTNMIDIYHTLEEANVPYSDRIVTVTEEDKSHRRVVQFTPVGRCYLPETLDELLDALICVCTTLTVLNQLGIMHRDIRWANVFHALADDNDDDGTSSSFTRDWYLFDFEYAAHVPQEAFPAHTLTSGNHAPEMILQDDDDDNGHNNIGDNHHHHHDTATVLPPHDTAVDIWGLGYLIQHAHVDVPESHYHDLIQLQQSCLQANPHDRPTAAQCLEQLQALQAKPVSIRYDDYFS